MTVLHILWMPIVLSSVFVFVASFILHMLLSFWHKSDYGKVPDEDKVMDALRPFAIPPGDYAIPQCSSPKEMNSPEFKEKMKKGPVVIATFFPADCMSMGRNLALWFLYVLVISYLSGYVSLHALAFGATYRHVFRIAGMAAFLGFAGALWPFSIWYRRSWLTTIKATIDGLIYAGLVAGTFGWLWPR